MSYKFGATSMKRLYTCHKNLQYLMLEAIDSAPTDFCILEGYRGKRKQNDAWRGGFSTLKFPQSKHNKKPAIAVDIAPYPVDWQNRQAFIDLSMHIFMVAGQLSIKIRWGGDWNMNGNINDERFQDLPHYELI